MKSIEAVLRGYILFRVNGLFYLRYATALAMANKTYPGFVQFDGWHIWKGWRGFIYRTIAGTPIVLLEGSAEL